MRDPFLDGKPAVRPYDGTPHLRAFVAGKPRKEDGQEMGLFDFVRNIGNKLFASDASAADAAAKIQREVADAGLGIDNLQVKYDPSSGNCALSGTCPSAEVMQKAVLIAGNVQGVSNVDVTNLDLVEAQSIAAAADQDVEYYVIVPGDNLSKIAKHFYGNPNLYPKIFDANREVIKHPDKIFPGQKIRIPRAA
jgi:nucleoid-associated protein YgaU